MRLNVLFHMIQGILDEYIDKDETVKYEASSFPLNSKFYHELFPSLPMNNDASQGGIE